MDTIKPKSVEYLQKRHDKAKGHGHGRDRFRSKSPRPIVKPNGHGPVKSSLPSNGVFCGTDSKHTRRTDYHAWKSNCYKCGIKGHFGQVCRRNPLHQQHAKTVQAVQEVQANDPDQNTGKTKKKDVNIVNMIRSLGLHDQCETIKDSQLCQHISVQELCIQNGHPTQCASYDTECNLKPVLQAPVNPTNTSIVCENCQDIVELDIHVATPRITSNEVNVIMIHDVELKCSHYSYVTIGRHPVKIKQDTGAQVNMMSKHVFDKLSNGNNSKSNASLLNKAQTTEITGYDQNP